MFFSIRKFPVNAWNILFSFSSKWSHLYFSFHDSWNFRVSLIGAAAGIVGVVLLSRSDFLLKKVLRLLPALTVLALLGKIEIKAIIWWGNFTCQEDQWQKSPLVLGNFHSFSTSGRPLSSSTASVPTVNIVKPRRLKDVFVNKIKCCPSYTTKACHLTSQPSRPHTVPPESKLPLNILSCNNFI